MNEIQLITKCIFMRVLEINGLSKKKHNLLLILPPRDVSFYILSLSGDYALQFVDREIKTKNNNLKTFNFYFLYNNQSVSIVKNIKNSITFSARLLVWRKLLETKTIFLKKKIYFSLAFALVMVTQLLLASTFIILKHNLTLFFKLLCKSNFKRYK